MDPLDLQSERYSATGNLASRGVLNQLGRPSMDQLTLLLRETVQNSWDARLSDVIPVRYTMKFRIFEPCQEAVLREIVFRNTAPRLGLSRVLETTSPLRVLEIIDRGTTGLRGPTRADVPRLEGEERDFVDFLRNIGQPPTRTHGGGTFGYGKAAAYLASESQAICVHTHCVYRGQATSRFMGAALGEQFESVERGVEGIYTGRHWWGRQAPDLVEPIEAAEADALASLLGMSSFAEDEYGTTLMILQPLFESDAPATTMEQLAGSIAWNFWPKMMNLDTGTPAMQFRVLCNEDEVPVPDPVSTPPLSGFVAALAQLDADDGNGLFPIASQRPARHLGVLSLTKVLAEDAGRLSNGKAPGEQPGERSHHVALLRTPRLVVKYLPGPRLISDVAEYAGVFLVDEALDDTFAQSEPPAHDDWVAATLLERSDRVFVNQTFKRIGDTVEEFAEVGRSELPEGGQNALGLLSERLGGLLPGIDGTGPGHKFPAGKVRKSGPGTGRPGTNLRARVVVDDPALGVMDGRPIIEVAFRVEHAPETAGTRVTVRAAALLEGTQLEADPPEGAPLPAVVGWQDDTGASYEGSPSIEITRDSSLQWRVRVLPIRDAQTGIEFVAEAYV